MAANTSPFSLKDMCKFRILSCIDEYPLSALSSLPISIRRTLLTMLTVCDRLHFRGTSFFDGLEDVPLAPPNMQPLHEHIFSMMFSYTEPLKFIKVAALNFLDAISCFDCFNESTDPNETFIAFMGNIHHHCDNSHYTVKKKIKKQSCTTKENINSIFASFRPIYVMNGYFYLQDPSTNIPDSSSKLRRKAVNTVLIPARHFRFLTVEERNDCLYLSDHVSIQRHKAGVFIDYCNLLIPKMLEIDTAKFLFSAVWNDYQSLRDAVIKRRASRKQPAVKILPTFPYLQKIMSSIECLKVGTNNFSDFVIVHHEIDCYIEIPYLLLCNIVSDNFQSIEIFACTPKCALHTFYTIAGFLCGDQRINSSHYEMDKSTRLTRAYALSMEKFSQSLKVEKLAIKEVPGMTDNVASSTEPPVMNCTIPESELAVAVVKQMLLIQKYSLKDLDLSGIEFAFKNWYIPQGKPTSLAFNDEYLGLLSSVFTEFVTLPQFQSLVLGEIPENYCYDLIAAYLTAPSEHEQGLHLSIITPYWSSLFPHTCSLTNPNNLSSELKSLIVDYQSDGCVLSQQVIGLQMLTLKKLQVPVSCIPSISSDTHIRIEHICLDFRLPLKEHSKTIEHRLISFFVANTNLKTVEFLYNPDDINPLFWSLAAASLEAISNSSILEGVCLHSDKVLPPSHRSTKPTSAGYDFSNFSTSLNFHFPVTSAGSSTNAVTSNSSQHYSDFFSLVRKLKLSLSVLGEGHLFSDEYYP